MADVVDFDLNDSLKQYLSDPALIATPEADSALAAYENTPEDLDVASINSVLDSIIDAVAESPDAILQSRHFDTIQFLLKCASVPSASQQSYIHASDCERPALSRFYTFLQPFTLRKILDLVVSGLSSEADAVHNDLDANETDSTQHHKHVLERYGFVLQWTIASIESKAAERSASDATSVARPRGGVKATKVKAGKDNGDALAQVQAALDTMNKVLKLRLTACFVTTSERDTFIGLFTRAVYLVQESEARMKVTAIRMHTYKVLCVAIKHHGHAFGTIAAARMSCTL